MASSIWITRGPPGSSIPVGMCYAVVEPRAEPSPDPRRRPHELAPQRKSVPGQCCAYFWPAISPLDNRRRSGLIELIDSGTRGLVGRVSSVLFFAAAFNLQCWSHVAPVHYRPHKKPASQPDTSVKSRNQSERQSAGHNRYARKTAGQAWGAVQTFNP